MSKSLLVETIVAEHGLTKVAANEIVGTILDTIVTTVKKEGKIALPNIGTFQVAKRPARKGRNPSTGEAIKIPAKNTVRFKASTVIKEAVAKTKVAK